MREAEETGWCEWCYWNHIVPFPFSLSFMHKYWNWWQFLNFKIGTNFLFLRMSNSIGKEHTGGLKSLPIEDERENIVWDLETNRRNNFFPGENEQISSTFYMGDFDSVTSTFQSALCCHLGGDTSYTVSRASKWLRHCGNGYRSQLQSGSNGR